MSLRTARGRAEESSRCELEAVRALLILRFISCPRGVFSRRFPMGSSMRTVPPQFISWGFQLIIKFWDQKIKIHFLCEAKHRRGRFWHLENGALHNNQTYTCCKCRNQGLQNNCLGRCLAHLQRQQKGCRGFFALAL